VAFESDRSGTTEIWTGNADGSDPQRLTSFGGPLTGSPRWSPDSRRIAFDSRAPSEGSVYVVGPDGGVPQRVATGLTDSTMPTWSRDGLWLYFNATAERESQIFKVRAEGGAATQITRHGGLQPEESPDGQRIYYLRGANGRGELWSVLADGGDESPVSGTPRQLPEWAGEWAVGSSGIYFVEGAPPAGIEFLDFKSGRIRRVAGLPGKPRSFGVRLGLSRDERTLLFCQVDTLVGDIMLVENLR